jgi:F0F1-type ATP synthase delta subunit
MKNKKIIAIWARVLLEKFESQTATENKKTLKRVQEVLKQSKKDYLLPQILDIALKDLKKRRQFELTFARAQDRETVEIIKRQLVSSFGKDRDAAIAIDPEIIGGFIAKTEDHIIDASIRDYLERLRRQYAT